MILLFLIGKWHCEIEKWPSLNWTTTTAHTQLFVTYLNASSEYSCLPHTTRTSFLSSIYILFKPGPSKSEANPPLSALTSAGAGLLHTRSGRPKWWIVLRLSSYIFQNFSQKCLNIFQIVQWNFSKNIPEISAKTMCKTRKIRLHNEMPFE